MWVILHGPGAFMGSRPLVPLVVDPSKVGEVFQRKRKDSHYIQPRHLYPILPHAVPPKETLVV